MVVMSQSRQRQGQGFYLDVAPSLSDDATVRQLTQFSVMKTMTCLFSQACLGYHLSSFPTWTHRHTSYTSIGGDKTLVIPTHHSLLHTRLARSDGILYVQAKIT